MLTKDSTGKLDHTQQRKLFNVKTYTGYITRKHHNLQRHTLPSNGKWRPDI